MRMLDTVVIDPPTRPDATVILMHGLGADGHDFEPVVSELRLPASPSVRWVFPHAPVRPVTLNDGYPMRAWYDIAAIDPDAAEDEEGILDSAAAIETLIRAEEERGVPSRRIIVAGFSQGGAMAIHVGLRRAERLCGIIALSCYLLLPATVEAEASAARVGLPVFMGHGTRDTVVPFAMATAARDVLIAQGCEVSWHDYPMDHGVCAEEIADLREWILRVLAQSTGA